MRGKNAGIFRETEKWTPEEREKMVQQTNSIYFDNFVPKVSLGRRKTAEEGKHAWDKDVSGREHRLKSGGWSMSLAVWKRRSPWQSSWPIYRLTRTSRRVVLPEPKAVFESYFGEDSSSESAKAERTQAALLDACRRTSNAHSATPHCSTKCSRARRC
jgi:hypothetical protein